MPEPSAAVFVRRGAEVKGPIAFSKALALLESGTLRPTDQVATSPRGPWTSLRHDGSSLPVVEDFTIKRPMFGGEYIAHYRCPKCGDSLESSESEMSRVETCPECGQRFQLSPRVGKKVGETKIEYERQRAEVAAATQRERERKAAERQEAAARRSEERQRQVDARREEDAARVVAARHLQQHASAVRRRGDSCWYCGCSLPQALPQCYACRMPARSGSK